MEDYEEYYPTIDEAIEEADYTGIYNIFNKIQTEDKFDAKKMLRKLFTGEPYTHYSLLIAMVDGYANWLTIYRRVGNSQVSDYFSLTEEYWRNGKFTGEIYRKDIGLLGDSYDRVYMPYRLIEDWVKDRFLSA